MEGTSIKDPKWGKGGGQGRTGVGRKSARSQEQGRDSGVPVEDTDLWTTCLYLPLRCANAPPFSQGQPGWLVGGRGQAASSCASWDLGQAKRQTSSLSPDCSNPSSQLEGFLQARPPCPGHL